MKKFQIYFKLNEKENYTLSISRIDEVTNTYKLRVIYEHFNKISLENEKLKIKEFHLGAKDVLEKINKISFEREYSFDINSSSYYQISFDNKKIKTTNKEEILDILNDFGFLEILKISSKEYLYIQDMYEYIKLKKLFLEECSKLTEEEIMKISEAFDNNNPYEIFEHISFIKDYCKNL